MKLKYHNHTLQLLSFIISFNHQLAAIHFQRAHPRMDLNLHPSFLFLLSTQHPLQI